MNHVIDFAVAARHHVFKSEQPGVLRQALQLTIRVADEGYVMSEANVLTQVQLLLTSYAANRIDFELDGIHFRGSELVRVLTSILMKQQG